MTENDPMAAEWARAAVAEIIQEAGYDAYAMGDDADPDNGAARFIDAHTITWEYDVNDAGVPVRRYVARSAWEVDPNPPPASDLYTMLAVRRDALGELP